MGINELIAIGLSKYADNLKINESSWYNGYAYMPLYKYDLTIGNKDTNEFNFQLYYEYRSSEYIKSSVITGRTEVHLLSAYSTILSDAIFFDFRIESVGFLKRIFQKNNIYDVKCSDFLFKDWLIKSESLKEIFKFMNVDPEFDPILIGEIKDSKLEVSIRFNTQKFHEKLIEHIIIFIKSLGWRKRNVPIWRQ